MGAVLRREGLGCGDAEPHCFLSEVQGLEAVRLPEPVSLLVHGHPPGQVRQIRGGSQHARVDRLADLRS
jgi:hypothetical protein